MLTTLIGIASCALYQRHEEKSFIEWMRENNRYFFEKEYQFRLGIFLTNSRLVKEHNPEITGYKVGLNHLSHLTHSEYISLLGHKSRGEEIIDAVVTEGDVPGAWDWREKNVVNSIKDQAGCGSCYAFSIIQAQESQWALKKGKLPVLSEQNVVDCVYTCNGCHGGDEYVAYDFIIKHQEGMFMTESDYPYKAMEGKCRFAKSKGCCPIKSYIRPTTTQNEEELKKGCYEKGVVSVAMDASGWDFQQYTGGIYNPARCKTTITELDHAVGLVGYGNEAGVDYWLIRNSYGVTWGEKGYMKLIRNHNNKCGIATDVIIPLVE